jgi:hypothetical protein
MPQAGTYRVTVTNKSTGAFIGIYPVVSDGTTPPESLALESAVIDGRFDTVDEAQNIARCTVIPGFKH